MVKSSQLLVRNVFIVADFSSNDFYNPHCSVKGNTHTMFVRHEELRLGFILSQG